MGKKKTHEQYLLEVNIKNPHVIGASTPILHKCKYCGKEWLIRPSDALNGKACRECGCKRSGLRRRKSHKKYLDDLSRVNIDIEPIEDYINTDTAILHRCKICGHIWPVKPNHTLSGHGCPMCGFKINADNKRKTQEQYIQELFYVNPDIEVVGEYINYITPLLHRCNRCGNEWEAKPAHTMRGHGCTSCNESHGERRVSQWLDRNSIKYISQYKFDDCRDINPLPFDFYLPKLNVCIEYQGHQHYYPIEFFGGQAYLEYVQYHDQIKSDYCIKNNIALACIPYWEDINEYLNNFLLI